MPTCRDALVFLFFLVALSCCCCCHAARVGVRASARYTGPARHVEEIKHVPETMQHQRQHSSKQAVELVTGEAEAPHENATALFEKYWDELMDENPEYATILGHDQAANRSSSLTDLSLEAFKRRHNRTDWYLQQARSLLEDAPEADVLNLELFIGVLETNQESMLYQEHLMPITQQEGVQLDFPQLVTFQRFEMAEDYEHYVARLKALPLHIDQTITLMKEGVKQGLTLPRVVVQAVPDQIAALCGDCDENLLANETTLEASVLFKPCTAFPATVPSGRRPIIRDRVLGALRDSVFPAFSRLHKYFTSEYLNAARETTSSAALPNGNDYYQYRVRRHTTTDKTPRELHDLGLREVARIREQMHVVMKNTDSEHNSGSMKDFVDGIRKDPRFYYNTTTALLEHIAAITKRADGELPKLFVDLPRCPYTVKAIPDAQAPAAPAAYYWEPDHDCSRPGVYYVNTYNLAERPSYLMESTALHEAVPGHHLQLSTNLELGDLPQFRRQAPWTAYIEGWALYSESLGEQMGFYSDPYNKFGALGDEILRAARLVVDTGLHAFDWTREAAVAYMTENTPLSHTDIASEVDRYIADPGQALAYKCGELKIKELREDAHRLHKEMFDIRKFHAAVLRGGPLPLDVLDDQITARLPEFKRASD
eukprot:gnl/Spiro4/6119_TR3146_c0_g1_i1.p1 gnl/Spiro4/6119_TR3146_c0_g1~~gnl/Spiro4/6119_TR3146_c0_g1_i1.p1  ORF type:complete len:654 (+),score=212.55 gnl/Spiro4/6119_TR3146_c0_g1_i1:50-2011(+)